MPDQEQQQTQQEGSGSLQMPPPFDLSKLDSLKHGEFLPGELERFDAAAEEALSNRKFVESLCASTQQVEGPFDADAEFQKASSDFLQQKEKSDIFKDLYGKKAFKMVQEWVERTKEEADASARQIQGAADPRAACINAYDKHVTSLQFDAVARLHDRGKPAWDSNIGKFAAYALLKKEPTREGLQKLQKAFKTYLREHQVVHYTHIEKLETLAHHYKAAQYFSSEVLAYDTLEQFKEKMAVAQVNLRNELDSVLDSSDSAWAALEVPQAE